MKKSVSILCLANSDKNEGRCIAGLRLDTGGWLRPVSSERGGALVEDHYITRSGQTPGLLDSVHIGLKRQYPKYNQPENWVVSLDKWKLVSTELDRRQLLVLNTALQHEGPVIFDTRRSIPKYILREEPIPNSLTVLRPRKPTFHIKESDGNRRPYADFSFDGHDYSLPITDPKWREIVKSVDVTSLPSADIVEDSKEILFTISLGEAYNGRCYKLIAAIFTVDSDNLLEI